jgi:hypothetical protein
MNKQKLKELQKELKEQDNLATDHPIYVVYDWNKNYFDEGIEGVHEYVWINDQSEFLEEKDLIEELREEGYDFKYDEEFCSYEEHEKLCDVAKEKGWEKRYFVKVREFISAFFTRKSAEDFIKRNGYNWNEPHIYVHSLWRNDEMKEIRNYFLNMDLSDKKLNSDCKQNEKT